MLCSVEVMIYYFYLKDAATTVIDTYGHTLSLHDALPIYWVNNHSSLNDAQARVDKDGLFRAVISAQDPGVPNWLDTAGNASGAVQGRRSEEHTSELQSLMRNSYAVFCLKTKHHSHTSTHHLILLTIPIPTQHASIP